MSLLDEHLKRHRKRIIDREEATFRELLAAYLEIEKDLKKSFAELQQEILEAQESGEEINQSWFLKEDRLKKLLAETQRQVLRFGGTAANIVKREQRAAVKIAIEQAQETYKLLIKNTPGANAFAPTLNTRAVETAVGIMGDGSPIIEYFEQNLAPMVADRIKTEVTKAAALGTDFSTIARHLQETGGITRYRAFSVARTETNRVRRETTREIFKENDDLVEGWEWVASKSSRTCPLCLAMDGRTFPLDEPFPQHINCRCTMISILKGLKRLPRTIGKDWFETQSDKVKEEILGKEAFAAYQDKDLSLDDFVAFRNDQRFGKSVTRKPLAKILADKGFDNDAFTEINLPTGIKVDYERGTKTLIKNILGNKKFSDDEIGALVGALDGATVKVSKYFDNVSFVVSHPLIDYQERTLGLDINSRPYFYNDYFKTLPTAPKGTGLRSFATQAYSAKKYGVEYISTLAAGYYGHPEYNGYYTWARMGYNAKLTDADRNKLPKKYEKVQDLNELMEKGGADAWKKYGTERKMLFDLSDDSKSFEVLENYLRERRFVVKF